MPSTIVRDRLMLSYDSSSQRFWGIFLRRERWSLSWRGWLLFALVLLVTFFVLLRWTYPFLAVTHRVDTNVLVVEGWIHEYAIRAAVKEFQSNHYERVLTTGGPVAGIGGYINDFQTSASVGADLLKKAGVPDEFLQMVPSRISGRDRTYSSAVALRDWIQKRQSAVRRINVLTENTHARRTWMLFQKALGKNVQVGVIAVPNPDYDNRRWWGYSEGVKDVGSEALAYVYARLFFHPSESPRPETAATTFEGDAKQ
jgi:uncharacterized SAM-binding protein YcdF (DUF218 family)